MSLRKCWSLFNKEEKLRIDDVTVEQVRTILLSIPSARMSDWYACREGNVHWQTLGEIEEFYEDVHAVKSDSKPAQAAEARRPLFEDNPLAHQTAATLQMESVQTKERRSARRFSRKLLFRASALRPNGGEQKFESQTIDISMSGLSINDPLPAAFGKNFRATLSLHDVEMQVVCSRVGDHQIKIVDAEAWDVLRQWIANW